MSEENAINDSGTDEPTFDILIDWSDEPAGVVKASVSVMSDKDLQRMQDALERAMGTMKAMARRVADTVRELEGSVRPNEAEVEFGINLSAEAGALLAKASTEAQISVKLKWEIAQVEPKPEIPIGS